MLVRFSSWHTHRRYADSNSPGPNWRWTSMHAPITRSLSSSYRIKWASVSLCLRVFCISRFRIHEPLGQVAVRVDPAVAEEGPVRSAELHALQVAGDHDDFFLVDAGTLDDSAVGGGDERLAPELDAVV